jgi:hypothetical protein
MRVRISFASAVVVLLALSTVLAPTAVAAKKKKVPKVSSFMGMNLGTGITESPVWSAQGVVRAAKIGTGYMRSTFFWDRSQPYGSKAEIPADKKIYFKSYKGRPITYLWTDAVVGAAAKRGITILPVITATPGWASAVANQAGYVPPKDYNDYARFLTALVRRYGPKGSFWKENKKLPKKPIRAWQIWNEPSGYCGFGDQAYGYRLPGSGLPFYVQLLKTSRAALRKADKGAKTVGAGFFGRSWNSVTQLYAGGGGKYADIIAIHPYDVTVAKVTENIEKVRAVMDRNGDTKKPIMVTEFGWMSGQGQINDYPFTLWDRTEAGQGEILLNAYSRLYAMRNTLKLKALFWYVLVTRDQPITTFDYSGLFRWRLEDQKFVAKPAAAAYKKASKYIVKKKVPPAGTEPAPANLPPQITSCGPQYPQG